MIYKFLRAKHWQLFCFVIVVPMVIQGLNVSWPLDNVQSENNSTLNPMIGYLKLSFISMALIMAGFFSWLWSVGVGLQSKLPENTKMKVTIFKVSVAIPLVYTLTLIWFVPHLLKGFQPHFIMLMVAIPLHLLAMFCIFYNFYFAAKTIKSVELGRDTSFSDFDKEFFMIWFFAFGIWFLQPRVNRIAKA